MSTIFGRRLRQCVAVLAAAGAILTGTAAGSIAQAIEPPPNSGPETTSSQAGDTTAPGDVEPQIIGGGEASEPYSWMATLAFVDANGNDTGHQCGATLTVSRKWVTTAAHCVKDPPANPTAEQREQLSARFGPSVFDHTPSEGSHYVRVGSHDRTTGGETANVTQIVVHKDFDWFENSPPEPAADIAMLKLDHELNSQPIQLAGEAAQQNDEIRLLGWGITEPDTTGPDPIILQELDTTVAPDAQCRFGIPGDITEGEICAANPFGTDGPCFGDSGGPAIKKGADGRWKFVGVTSRGDRWCGTTAAIYTSPPDYRKWIYDTARGTSPVTAPVGAKPVTELRKTLPTYTLPTYTPPTLPCDLPSELPVG